MKEIDDNYLERYLGDPSCKLGEIDEDILYEIAYQRKLDFERRGMPFEEGYDFIEVLEKEMEKDKINL